MYVPLESHHMDSAFGLGVTSPGVTSISFSWNHRPTHLSQFSSRVVRQFGADLTYKLTFLYLIWKDSKKLERSGRHNSSFLMITGKNDGQGECPSWPPCHPNSPVLPHTSSTWHSVFTWGCSNRAQQSYFYLGLAVYLHGKHFYKRKGNVHFKISYKNCPLEISG